MSLDDAGRTTLWGKSGNQCAFPGCTQKLSQNSLGGDGSVVIGEEAHIRAHKSNWATNMGPKPARQDPSYPKEKLDDEENLILLCPNQHTEIDKDEASYPIEKVIKMKSEHVERMASRVS